MEHLSLALANASWLDGDSATPQTLAAWWAGVRDQEAGARVAAAVKPRFDASLVAQARTLRAAIRELLRAGAQHRLPGPDSVDRLNAILGRSRLEIELRPGALETRFVSNEGADGVLAPLAHSVLHVLRTSAGRLRECAADGCTAFFVDATKNRSRRWCSLACMERTRSPRRQAARNRPQ